MFSVLHRGLMLLATLALAALLGGCVVYPAYPAYGYYNGGYYGAPYYSSGVVVLGGGWHGGGHH